MLAIDVKDLRARLSRDGEFTRYARQWTGSFAFLDEASHLRIEVRDGLVAGVSNGPNAGSADVAIAGPADGWQKVFAPLPPPFYQDLLGGAVGRHGFAPSGDLGTLTAYYGAIQRAAVLAGRSVRGEPL
jgi:hypothetical protein